MRLPEDWAAAIGPGDEKSIELIGMLLEHVAEPASRHHYAPGHLTATGLVLGPDGESMVMVLHGRLNRWLLPGGHVEPEDGDIYAAAAREVAEETGLRVSGGEVIGADVHGIPPKWKNGVLVEPYHQHHDILVGFATVDTELVISEESREVRWVHPREFDAYAVPANIRRAYARWVASRLASRARRDSQ